jgi:ankyrin repeat protein
MWAARAGATGAMAALLDAGADADVRDGRFGWTALLHAVHTRQSGAVALLLERGADPNAATPRGVTALMMAADDPDPAIVARLLEYGAEPTRRGPGGRTALSQAVSGGALTDFEDRPLLGGCHPATVRALLDHDPALRLPNNLAAAQALWWAHVHGCDEVLRRVEARTRASTHLGTGLPADTAR